MLNKEQFCKVINDLKTADELDEKYSKSISDAFDCYALNYVPSNHYQKIIIDLLNDMFNLESYEHIGTDIEYFIYDLDYGKKWKTGMITDRDGTDIDLSTPEKLYDFITRKSNDSDEIIIGC